MKAFCPIFIAALVSANPCKSYSQGFVNLNFENANVSAYSPGDHVSINDAIPGWGASFFQANPGSHPSPPFVAYDAISLGGAGISVNDTNTGFSFTPISGKFSAFLFGGAPETSVTISQSGLVPVGTQSIQMRIGNYMAVGAFTVTLNDQQIGMTQLAVFPSYTLFGGDVSAFANQTAALSITALGVTSGPGPNPVLLDNIQFSSSPIPEPDSIALSALGGLLLSWRVWKRLLP